MVKEMIVKALRILVFIAAFGASLEIARAALKLGADQRPQSVFSGEARPIRVTFQNPENKTAEADLRLRLHQTSSAKTVLIGEQPWIKLHVLPGITFLASAAERFLTVQPYK